ncbi:conjugative transfer system coupling protein TraD [Shewanella sp. SG44-6]|jgi:conjugal transfer pilus assembly protein TraD|uniref:conjugative transfer system coupling protein TraD n=1 Tax=Shewanella sp. SG44-6 TaxID=2760959 RepID=UPI0016001C14|nr:conjugative transfer system coupling protein TraD [Shewanella sp. SG44-6]MBB1390151.1 conjugative transfer system coupling protein TraD [Shewanella sp. SG44-6]
MSSNNSNGIYLENLFRPIFELKSSYFWAASVVGTLGAWSAHTADSPQLAVLPLSIIAASCGMCVKRFKDALPLLRRQLKLQFNYYYFLDANEFRERNLKDQTKSFLGKGFEWDVEMANRAYQLQGMTDKDRVNKLPIWLNPVKNKWKKDTAELEGYAWINGVGDEKEIIADASIHYSHNLYTGLPGVGKTVMLTMASTNSLHRGCSVLVTDPKNDPNWRKRLKAECEALGVPFYYFSTANPSISVRIDPTKNFTVTTELASRLANTLDGDGDSGAFKAYAWDSFYLTADALRFVGRKPSIKSISDYMLNRKYELAEEGLDMILQKHIGSNWRSTMTEPFEKVGGGSLLTGMIMYYKNTLVPSGHGNDTISGFLGFVTHDASHQSKMLASTKPILQQLTASPLDELLSPDPDADDPRPIIDLKKFADTGGVLYVATDSMGNSEISSVVSKLIMEDACAAAATRYNHEQGEGRRTAVFVDEAHAAISDGLINLMAQGRGAKYELHVATQSYADLAEVAGKDLADRIVGLTSNWFCMRVLDTQTKNLMKEQLPEVPIKVKQWQLNNSTNTSTGLASYSGSVGERIMEADKVSFPIALLGALPKFQYLARLADGRMVLGRVPILK